MNSGNNIKPLHLCPTRGQTRVIQINQQCYNIKAMPQTQQPAKRKARYLCIPNTPHERTAAESAIREESVHRKA